jgi:squalene-hopene/tetraprenyl-beta-curcumene cyclase
MSPKHALVAILFALAAARAATAADDAETSPDAARLYENTVAKAVDYCRTKGQAADGSYSAEAGPAVTAIVTAGILRTGRTADDPLVAASLKYLEGFVREDGGIYPENSRHRNYETCIAIQCFSEANRDKRYDKLIQRAEAFVRGIQWDTEDDIDKSSPNFGGAGYGRSGSRPDLSNTSFLLDALKSVGAGPDDEAVQNALVFVSRCQNLETEFNTTPFAAKVNDGGFYYTPSDGGSSQAGDAPGGGLRSYGSMTYAGLKSMIYAGLNSDDPRVKAAVKWIGEHYSLEENPGMGSAGLFYYYQAFARALAALGVDEFADSAGKQHDWRAELVAELAARQQPDGSWINENSRWLEGNPNLVTGYALLALSYARK